MFSKKDFFIDFINYIKKGLVLINSLKDFQTYIKEFISTIFVLVASLYAAAKGSPMAYIAGVVTVVLAIILFLIIKKVLYERKRRKETFIGIGW